MFDELLNEFSDLLSWIRAEFSSSVKVSGSLVSVWSLIVRTKYSEIIKLESTKQIASLLYILLENNMPSVWYSLRYAEPKPEQIIKFSKEKQLELLCGSIISKFLYCYTKENGLEYNHQVAKKYLVEWIEELKQETVEKLERSPILNVEIEAVKLQLTEEISITKLSDSEKNSLIEKISDFSRLLIFSHFSKDIVIERKFRENLRSRKPINHREFYSRILTIFRLIKPDWVYFGDLIFHKETTGLCKDYAISYTGSTPIQFQTQSKYSIKVNEEQDFIELFNYWDSLLPNYSRFPLWLSRYNDSYDRQKNEDAILDLMIVLEALFSDSLSEMTHKISTRSAVLLSHDSSVNPSNIVVYLKEKRAKLKKLYAIRSKIIHGEKVKISHEEVVQHREVIRCIIKNLISVDPCFLKNDWKICKERLLPYLDFNLMNEITKENKPPY